MCKFHKWGLYIHLCDVSVHTSVWLYVDLCDVIVHRSIQSHHMDVCTYMYPVQSHHIDVRTYNNHITEMYLQTSAQYKHVLQRVAACCRIWGVDAYGIGHTHTQNKQLQSSTHHKHYRCIYSLLHLHSLFFNLNPQSSIQFSRSLLPRSAGNRPIWLRSEIKMKWHSKCNRLYERGGGLGSSTVFKNLMSPTPCHKWYLTTGRRAH